jgi:hypothetical protein
MGGLLVYSDNAEFLLRHPRPAPVIISRARWPDQCAGHAGGPSAGESSSPGPFSRERAKGGRPRALRSAHSGRVSLRAGWLGVGASTLFLVELLRMPPTMELLAETGPRQLYLPLSAFL